jgi:AcrR family transcriptional regulator
MPRAFNDNEKKIIEQTLIEQGKKQFSAFGLRKTNVEEIARAAGISKGAFYLFFPSKEVLFMRVMEEVEKEFRVTALSYIDLPGSGPRARLTNLLIRMFDLWRTVPILHVFNNAEYQILLRSMPDQTMEEHIKGDMLFIRDLLTRLKETGIELKIPPELFMQMMYAMFLVNIHGDDLGPGGLDPGKWVMLEIIAAYALGEITLDTVDITDFMKELRKNDLRD